MWRGHAWRCRILWATGVIVLTCCVSPPFSAAESAPAAPQLAAKQKGPPEKLSLTDRYEVPEGSVESLLKFLDDLRTFQPNSQEEFAEYQAKGPAAIKVAAEKILALVPNPAAPAHQRARGVLFQVAAMRVHLATPDEQRRLVNDVRSHLTGRGLTTEDVALAVSLSHSLEQAGAETLAAEACESLGALVSGSPDAKLAPYGELLQGSARRLKLVGKKMELAGTKLDGKKFALTELKGQVVLVEFWATWCGPSRTEFPHVKKHYEQLHPHGFEVVGVSVDRDRKDLEQYLHENPRPWIVLHEKDQEGKNPAAKRYGVFGIPTVFLLDRDGKVLSIHARGEELTRLLAEQFPNAQPTKQTTEE